MEEKAKKIKASMTNIEEAKQSLFFMFRFICNHLLYFKLKLKCYRNRK